MRARYYNPGIKRFINQDIVTGDITASPSLNQYSYVQGNPVSLTDPFGLCPTIDWTSIGHLTLDVLSVIPIPVFSDACSLVNAAWYYKEGNKTEAIAHMIGSMSLVGDVLGAGLKACRLTKTAKVIKYTTRIADATANTVIAGNHLSESVTSFMDSVEKGHPSFKDFCESVCYGFMFGMAASNLGANMSALNKELKITQRLGGVASKAAEKIGGAASRVASRVVSDLKAFHANNSGFINMEYKFGEGGRKTLLPGEGDIGIYKDLIKAGKRGDNITPHHMPSAEYMSKKGIARNDGLCMNMEMPVPGSGGRHRLTDTYGGNMTDAEKAFYYSLSPRDALAYDIKNLRKIYQNDGLYDEIRPQLIQYIKTSKTINPELFEK